MFTSIPTFISISNLSYLSDRLNETITVIWKIVGIKLTAENSNQQICDDKRLIYYYISNCWMVIKMDAYGAEKWSSLYLVQQNLNLADPSN